MGGFLIYLVTFFYIYSVNFQFIPVGTRVILGVAGFCLFFLSTVSGRKIHCHKQYCYMIFSLIILVPVSLVSVSYNATSDYEFLRYVISILVINFAAYFVFFIFNRYSSKPNFSSLVDVIINIVAIQSVISVFMFLFPWLGTFLLSLQNLSIGDIQKLNQVNEFRLIGFGTFFFGAGVIHGFSLILASMRFREIINADKDSVFILSCKFFLILAIGLMMSRTTIVGACIGLFYIAFSGEFNRINTQRILKKIKFFSSFIFIILSFLLVLKTVPGFWKTIEPIFDFVFEMAINYIDNNNAESESTNHLLTMYVFPENLKTWLIGDGIWNLPNGSYYMDSDVGYVRLIFYFGILGLTLYFLYHAILISISFELSFTIVIAIYFLLINLKGFTDLTPLILLFTHYKIKKRKNNEELYI